MPADPFFEGPSRKRKKSTPGKRPSNNNNNNNNNDDDDDVDGPRQSVKRPGAMSGGAPSERRRQALKKSNTKSKKTTAKDDESESDDEIGPGGIDDMDLEGYGEGGDYGDEAEDTENRETAAEKRLRLAKGYIENLKRDLGESGEYDAEDIDRDLIAERINDDALETAGRLHRNVVARYTFPIDESAIRSSKGHQLPVTCVAVDESMKVVYTGSKDGSIIKWDFKTGKKQHVFLGGRKGIKQYIGHTDHILSLAVSPDGRFLASGGRDRIINVWSVQENKHLHTFRHHKDGVSGLAFRKGSNQLYSCSLDRSVKLWDLDQMAYIETLFGHQDTVFAIDTLVKERAVTAGGRDRTVRMWKIVEESQLVFRGGGVAKQHGIQETEPNADGVKKREKRDAKNVPPGFLEGSVDVVALIDEDNFLSGGDSGGIALWNVDKKKPLFSLDSAHGVDPESNTPRWITALATLRYTDMFASGSWDGTVRVWKLTRGLRAFSHVAAIPVLGFINGLRLIAPPGSEGAATEAHIIAGVGQEHRMGRWKRIKEAKNGLRVIPLAAGRPITMTEDARRE